MECDALFAESDDEVVVLPPLPTMDITVSSANDQAPKPLSSNYVNSTTPTRPYEVNVAPISHPLQSRTPVPEEYQPLPDSSSSFDYSIGQGNPDSSNGDLRTNPINIRYQPKPQWPKNYCFPPSLYWEHRDPMYFNNYLLLGNYNGPCNPGSSFAIDSVHPRITPTIANDNAPPRENELPSNNASSNQNASAEVPPRTDLASWLERLERPSRQLNISPGRRQSRESETNPIELSSEEEDNTPRKRQCDNGAGYENIPTNLSRNNAQAGSNSREPAQVTVKGEPHDLTVATSRVDVIDGGIRQPSERRSEEDTPLPLTTRRPSANQPIQDSNSSTAREVPLPLNNVGFLRIKGENSSPMCRCGPNRIFHMQTDQCDRTSPRHNNVNRIYPGHRHHYHHHHNHHHHNHNHAMMVRGYPYQPCAIDASSSPSSSTIQVKTEPRQENINERPIKQEANIEDPLPQQASPPQSTLAPVNPSTEPVQVKLEPLSSTQTEAVQETVQIKVEPQREMANVKMEVDAGGDRNAASPQPGPSSGFVPIQPKVEPPTNTHQVNNHCSVSNFLVVDHPEAHHFLDL